MTLIRFLISCSILALATTIGLLVAFAFESGRYAPLGIAQVAVILMGMLIAKAKQDWNVK